MMRYGRLVRRRATRSRHGVRHSKSRVLLPSSEPIEERRRHQLAIKKIGERVEVPCVIALELEPRAVALAQPLQQLLDIFERVLRKIQSRDDSR